MTHAVFCRSPAVQPVTHTRTEAPCVPDFPAGPMHPGNFWGQCIRRSTAFELKWSIFKLHKVPDSISVLEKLSPESVTSNRGVTGPIGILQGEERWELKLSCERYIE